MNIEQHLSRRERQIMDVLHTKESATAAGVGALLRAPPQGNRVKEFMLR